ncbi:hypothetical protein ACFXB3_20975, partial [Streptomyces sp. NPDC059447]
MSAFAFETITVPEHLHGYPGVAYGGYVAGLLAGRATAGTVRVDFRRPVPTEAPVRPAGGPAGGGGRPAAAGARRGGRGARAGGRGGAAGGRARGA